MGKSNNHKKKIFQDNFIKHWCCSAHNHPKGWHWYKRYNRKLLRKHERKELYEEEI